MHNIDRTLQELELGIAGNGEYENAYENTYEFGANNELGQAFGQAFSPEANFEAGNFELAQQENLELEMAYQLMEVSNEMELNQFIGNLMGKALGAARSAATSFINSPTGKGVGQYLVNFGKQTLPQLATQYGAQAGGALGGRAGAAVGGRIGGSIGSRAGGWAGSKAGNWAGSRVGNWVGSKAGNLIASTAGRVFNLELETMSPENQELEIARSFVRFANDVTRRASQAVRRNPNIGLADLGRQVISSSAGQYAPGLLDGAGGRRTGAAQGNWVKRGNTIVLYGA